MGFKDGQQKRDFKRQKYGGGGGGHGGGLEGVDITNMTYEQYLEMSQRQGQGA